MLKTFESDLFACGFNPGVSALKNKFSNSQSTQEEDSGLHPHPNDPANPCQAQKKKGCLVRLVEAF